MDAMIAAHSGLRWLVVLGLVAIVAWAFTGARAGIPTWVRIVGGLFTLQWVLGVVLYVLNEGWSQGPFLAFWHPIAMTAGLGALQVGTARAGRGDGSDRMLGIMAAASLVLVLAGIPWFRGMG